MKYNHRLLMQLIFLGLTIPIIILVRWKPMLEHIQRSLSTQAIQEVQPLPEYPERATARTKPAKDPLVFTQNVDTIIKSMQQEFKSINIQEQPSSKQVLLDNKKPIKQYLITSKTLVKQQFFDKYKYTIETGGDPTQIKTPENICGRVDMIISQHEKTISDERIRELSKELKGEISASIGPLSSKVSGNSEFIAELIIFILRIKALESSRLQVLIKGYSDGVVNEENWPQTIELEKDGYSFNQIKVLMPIDSKSKNPFRYSGTETVFSVPQKYKNQHLPNLRSQFIKQDFIEPFINSCGTKESEIKILSGYSFKVPNQKEKRKVQVYVNLLPL
jgi:hypothetical protein